MESVVLAPLHLTAMLIMMVVDNIDSMRVCEWQNTLNLIN